MNRQTLNKIEKPREGFVYPTDNKEELIVVTEIIKEYLEFDGYEKGKLVESSIEGDVGEFEKVIPIGKIGRTHKLEDGKLVEIPRESEVMVGDVFEYEGGKGGFFTVIEYDPKYKTIWTVLDSSGQCYTGGLLGLSIERYINAVDAKRIGIANPIEYIELEG
jgi:hypothetical protein